MKRAGSSEPAPAEGSEAKGEDEGRRRGPHQGSRRRAAVAPEPAPPAPVVAAKETRLHASRRGPPGHLGGADLHTSPEAAYDRAPRRRLRRGRARDDARRARCGGSSAAPLLQGGWVRAHYHHEAAPACILRWLFEIACHHRCALLSGRRALSSLFADSDGAPAWTRCRPCVLGGTAPCSTSCCRRSTGRSHPPTDAATQGQSSEQQQSEGTDGGADDRTPCLAALELLLGALVGHVAPPRRCGRSTLRGPLDAAADARALRACLHLIYL